MNHNDEDGWDITDHEDDTVFTGMSPQRRYSGVEEPRDILSSYQHSLEPDMALGWKPKLPSCPLPLAYRNAYL